jgi:hypothetical protein
LNPRVFSSIRTLFPSIRTFCLQLKNAKYKSTPSWGKIFLGDFNYITVTLSVTFSVTPQFFFNEKYLTFQKTFQVFFNDFINPANSFFGEKT